MSSGALKRMGPQQNRGCNCTSTEEDAARVSRLIVRHGSVERARVALGIGESTMDSARACGKMMKKTREKLRAALEREESAA